MSYIRAEELLPREMVELLWQYAEGQTIYIPRRPGQRAVWGEKTKLRGELRKRNRQIYRRYSQGAAVGELADEYYLSVKSIQRIIREEKSQNRDKQRENGTLP